MSSLFLADRILNLLEKVVAALVVYVFFYTAFGGVARWILLAAHAMFINNLPNALAMGIFGIYIVLSMARLKAEKFLIFTVLIIGVFLIYALYDHLSFWQNAFGFYIWSGFLLGALLWVSGKEGQVFKYFPALWACTVIGVFINSLTKMPWAGMEYEVNGVTMAAARQWGSAGVDRLAGFTRASYSAATIIMISYCQILASKNRTTLVKFAAYILSCVAVFLTTSKSELAIVILLPIILYGGRALQGFIRGGELAYSKAVTGILVGLVVLLPVLYSSHAAYHYSGPSYGFLTGETMLMRTNGMWPEAFDLLDKDGSPLIGRGIGGVGTALGMNDPVPDEVNSADNLFVYVYVQAGLLVSIPFFLSFFLGWDAVYARGVEYFELLFLIAFCTLGVSITTGCIEDPMLGIFLGFLVARGYIRNRNSYNWEIKNEKNGNIVKD